MTEKQEKRYWTPTKPVKVTDVANAQNILSQEDLTRLLHPSNIKMDPVVLDQIHLELYSHLNITDEVKNQVLTFLNLNYSDEDAAIQFIYTMDVLNYYLNTEFNFLICYNKSDNTIIGILSCTKRNLCIYNKNFISGEMNLLCIKEDWRNKNLTSYFLNVLSSSCIKLYNCDNYVYSITLPITAPHFSDKNSYHRLFNIDKLFNTTYLSYSSTDIKEQQKQKAQYKLYYMDFDHDKIDSVMLHLNMTSTIDDIKYKIEKMLNMSYEHFISIIIKKINEFQNKTYDIYETMTEKKLEEMLRNKIFHNFVFFKRDQNKNTIITDFVSYFELDLFIKKDITKTNIREGNYYTGFITSNSTNLFNTIHKKIALSDIFDEVVSNDLALLDENGYETLKYNKGNCQLNYFLFNIELGYIKQNKNSLVTF